VDSRFVNGAILVLLGPIWVGVAQQFVPDTNLGVAILLAPSGVLVIWGACLIARWRIDQLRPPE
jgi:hypothetical protein